jgi:hypothetical protein
MRLVPHYKKQNLKKSQSKILNELNAKGLNQEKKLIKNHNQMNED